MSRVRGCSEAEQGHLLACRSKACGTLLRLLGHHSSGVPRGKAGRWALHAARQAATQASVNACCLAQLPVRWVTGGYAAGCCQLTRAVAVSGQLVACRVWRVHYSLSSLARLQALRRAQ